jgi:hypothetical protein
MELKKMLAEKHTYSDLEETLRNEVQNLNALVLREREVSCIHAYIHRIGVNIRVCII